jgi:hypothetical protein
MAEKERPSRPKSTAPTTPEDYTTTSSGSGIPGADYSYTVELVGSIQNQLGKLTESVNSLKEQSKETSKKLDDVRMDVHGAKVLVSAIGGLILLVGGVIAWLVNTYVSTHPPK